MNEEQFIVWLRKLFAGRIRNGECTVERAASCMKFARQFKGL